jgi:hypothetical protein
MYFLSNNNKENYEDNYDEIVLIKSIRDNRQIIN